MIPPEEQEQFRRARRLYEQGRPAEALLLLDDLARRSSNLADVLYARAICIHALGRDYEANLLCNKLNHLHGDARARRLQAIWRARRLDAANAGAAKEGETPGPLDWETDASGRAVAEAGREEDGGVAGQNANNAVYAGVSQMLGAFPVRGSRPNDPEIIQRLLGGLAGRDAMNALYELCERVGEADLPILHEMLRRHRSRRVREGLVRLLGYIGSPESVGPLSETLLKDTHVFARVRAAETLGSMRSAEALPALEQAIREDQVSRVRADALVAYHRIAGVDRFAQFAAGVEAKANGETARVLSWLLGPLSGRGTEPAAIAPGRIRYGYASGTLYGVYLPAQENAEGPPGVLVAVHDHLALPESVEMLMEQFRPDAASRGLAIIAPYFDHPTFPNYGMLNIGLQRTRADLRLFEILDAVSRNTPLRLDRFMLYEHGPARGFVNWFALAYPKRVERAVACLPRRFAPLNADFPFPFGLRPSPFAPELGRPSAELFLGVPLLLLAAQKGPETTTQELAQFQAALEERSAVLDTPPRVRLEVLEHANQVRAEGLARARAFLFGEE